MSELKPHDRQPYDTVKSWVAFCNYLELGSDRTIDALHRIYTGESMDPATKSFSTLKNWGVEKNWVERAKSYDAEQGKKLIEAMGDRQHEESLQHIKEFTKAHASAGRGGMDIILRLKKKISEFIQTPEAEVNNWADAARAARIIAALESPSSELWAKAIGVDKILDQIESLDGH